ncbi:hypothetical protein HBI65_193020 [Parastagonospora nodorum]|nr:hypothetical protein HBI65_193020 [Parastagonospora nodorum]
MQLLALLSLLPVVLSTPIALATCAAPNDSICAQFLFANGTVSQDIHINDGGCTDVLNSGSIAGIKVYDCWCGLWNAQDAGACNNGYDEDVAKIERCTGWVDGGKWKLRATHVSCYRP